MFKGGILSPLCFYEENYRMICNYSNVLATKHGINAALIAGYINYCLESCRFTVEENGCRWVRLSQKSITGIFPFMGVFAVRHAVRKLKNADIVVVEQLKKKRFDSTNHYTLTEYGRTVIKGDGDIE